MDAELNECTGVLGDALCLGFPNKFLITWVDSINNIVINGGTTEEEDDADPISIQDRGVFMNGDDYLTIKDFMMNASFSVLAWIRPDVDTFVIYSINKKSQQTEGAQDLLQFSINALKTQFTYTDPTGNIVDSNSDLVQATLSNW